MVYGFNPFQSHILGQHSLPSCPKHHWSPQYPGVCLPGVLVWHLLKWFEMAMSAIGSSSQSLSSSPRLAAGGARHRHTHLNLHPAFCALFSKLLQNHQPRQDGRTWQDTQLTTAQHILRPSGAWIFTTLLMLLFMISDLWFCWRYFSVLLLIIIIYFNISWMMDDGWLAQPSWHAATILVHAHLGANVFIHSEAAMKVV